jgi:putative transposase
MAYVDLNPVRAKMAKTPEASDHTSIKYRINAARLGKTPKRLMPFAGNPRQEMSHGLPFTLPDYLQLVDITSRYLHPNKRGKVEHDLPSILERLNIGQEHWLTLTTQFETCFKHAAGKVTHLEQYAHNQHQQRVQGRQSAMRLLG